MSELAHPHGLIQLPVLAAHHSRRLVYAVFVLVSSGVSIGIITAVAYGSGHPLVVPSLGPTAFLVFNRSQSSVARPRNIVLGHLIGAVCGYLALVAFGLGRAPAVVQPGGLTAARIGAAALSIALTSAVMILTGAEHGPAGATTLIVSLGFMTTVGSLGLLMIGVVALAVEGVAIDRLVGLRLPYWSGDRHEGRSRGVIRRTRPLSLDPPAERRGGSNGGDRGNPGAVRGRRLTPGLASFKVPTRLAEPKTWIAKPGEGRQVLVGAEEYTVKVEDARTDGSYSVVEVALDPSSPATLLHVHYGFSETYCVLEGEVIAEVGKDRARAGPGSVIRVPPGVPHLVNASGRGQARYLCITPRSQQSHPEFLP